MSDFEDHLEEFLKKNPWLREGVEDLKEAWEQVKQHQSDLNFRVSWLGLFSMRILFLLDLVLTDDQKETNEYQEIRKSINQHFKRFNPEHYENTLLEYRDVSEKAILETEVHPEEQIEKIRKMFDLEDLPKIITFDFIKTHFGDEQLEMYKKILEE